MATSKTASGTAATSKSAARARRQANIDKYAPRVIRTAPLRPVLTEDPRLLKLTAKVLDELKVPGAIPSRVIMDALSQAKTLSVH